MQPARENTTSKEKLLTLPSGNIAERSEVVGEDDYEWEPVKLITNPCDSVLGTEGYAPKSQF